MAWLTGVAGRVGRAPAGVPAGRPTGHTAPMASATERPERPAGVRSRSPAGPLRADLALAGVVYAVALAVNVSAVWAVSRSLVLTGEEMSVSVRDVLFSVQERTQASVWSTNLGAPVFYWAASLLDPSYSLFSARRWKAAAMALLPALVVLACRRRLGCTRVAAVAGGLACALLPGVAMFGWLATENGLDAVLGVAALLAATSRRRGWAAAPVLGGLAITTYPPGLAWTVVVVAVCALRAWRSPSRVRAATAVGAGCAAGLAVVVFPRLWWTGGPQQIGNAGGSFGGDPLHTLGVLGEQLVVSGRSYYFFADAPALGSPWLAAVVGVAAVVAVVARPGPVAPWIGVAVATAVLWAPTGDLPGLRRAVAISVVAAVVLAVAGDVVRRAWPRPAGTVATAVAAVLVLAPLAATAAAWELDHATGRRALVADFPIAPGPMPPTFARWDGELRAGRLTPERMARDDDGLRTLAVVWMLADRGGAGTGGLPTPDRILRATVAPELLPAR